MQTDQNKGDISRCGMDKTPEVASIQAKAKNRSQAARDHDAAHYHGREDSEEQNIYDEFQPGGMKEPAEESKHHCCHPLPV